MQRRHRRLAIVAGLAAATILATTSPVWAGNLGRRIPWFEIDRVEISGLRLLAPHEVLAASGIALGHHLLDEAAAWESALLEHPAIADVRLSRRPPGTLRIRVTEKRPAALIPDGTLRLVTAAGEILPVDPAAVPLDLPIVHAPLGDSTALPAVQRLLTDVERLADLEPALMRDVSEIRLLAGSADVMVLSHRAGEILLPLGASTLRLDELRRVLADAERRFPAPAGAYARKLRLDLRFADQVVVRPSSSRERP